MNPSVLLRKLASTLDVPPTVTLVDPNPPTVLVSYTFEGRLSPRDRKRRLDMFRNDMENLAHSVDKHIDSDPYLLAVTSSPKEVKVQGGVRLEATVSIVEEGDGQADHFKGLDKLVLRLAREWFGA